MYDLKIVLEGRIVLYVVYDKEAKEILASICIDDKEVVFIEGIAAKQWPPCDSQEDFSQFFADISRWVAEINKNLDFSKSITLQRN